MITNADITIFNKAIGENRREVFIPTTISGVSWYDVHSVEVSKQQGMAPRDRAAKFIVRIPLDAKVQDGRDGIFQCSEHIHLLLRNPSPGTPNPQKP